MSDDRQTATRQWLEGGCSDERARQTAGRLLALLVEEGPDVAPDGEYLRSKLPTASTQEYERVVDRAIARAKQAHARLAEERRSYGPALRAFTSSTSAVSTDIPGSETWAFVHGLTIETWEVDHPDPPRAVELATRGVELAMALDESEYGQRRTQDLRALAYAKLGNVLRIQSEFREAEIAFSQATQHRLSGTGDPLVRARIQLAELSFYGSLEKFDEAFALADRIAAIARRFDDEQLLGRVLLTRAYFESNAGHTTQALRLSRQALRHIDAFQEPRLVLVAWHNLILTLTYEDRYEEAADRLPDLRSLHEKFGNRLDRLRFQWVEGRIDLAMGRQRRGEEALERVRTSFIEAGVGFEAALVSLDLAHAYAKQKRSDDMRRLAEQMIPIFESRDMHREAIAALLVFQRATEMDRVNVRFVEELASFLRRSRGNPQLRFQPGE